MYVQKNNMSARGREQRRQQQHMGWLTWLWCFIFVHRITHWTRPTGRRESFHSYIVWNVPVGFSWAPSRHIDRIVSTTKKSPLLVSYIDCRRRGKKNETATTTIVWRWLNVIKSYYHHYNYLLVRSNKIAVRVNYKVSCIALECLPNRLVLFNLGSFLSQIFSRWCFTNKHTNIGQSLVFGLI